MYVEEAELAEQVTPVEVSEADKTEEALPVEKVDASGESFYAVYSETEMNEALSSGNLQVFFNMLNANSAATMGGVCHKKYRILCAWCYCVTGDLSF